MFIYYFTPILSILFFINCVTLAKKIKKEENTQLYTFLGSIMFGFIIFSIILAGIAS